MLFALDIANRALEQEGWARERLAAHAGRAVRIVVGPVHQAFAIDTQGRLHDCDGSPDLTLTVSARGLPGLLVQPERWGESVSAQGDMALAATLSELALALPWFVEAMLARAFGPVFGQALADLGRRLLALPDYGAQRFAGSVMRYLGDESRLAVGAAEARVVAAEIATLVARIDALASRVDALTDPPRSASRAAPAKGGAKLTRKPAH